MRTTLRPRPMPEVFSEFLTAHQEPTAATGATSDVERTL